MNEQLKNAIRTGQISHAYLFYGPDRQQKEEAARQFTAALNCYANADHRPCGLCISCQKMASGNHPDFREIAPDGVSIKIKQIRQLQQDLAFRRYEGRYTVILINQAEKMTEEAANSLLKVLEEPLGFVVFIILTANISLLLPTVVSRCQLIHFPKEQELPLLEKRRQYIDYLHEALQGDPYEITTLAQELDQNMETEELDRWLEFLVMWVRDILVWQETGKEKLLLNTEFIDKICEFSRRIKYPVQALEYLLSAQKSLKQNANKRLTIEVLLMRLCRAL